MAIKTDVTVIGAGLGGMLASAYLARSGLSVAMLEKRDIPGGRYTTIDFEGFKVNTGAWNIGVHGPNGPVYKSIISDLGCKIDIKIPGPPDRRFRVKGVDYDFPEKGGLRLMLEKVAKEAKETDNVMNYIRRALRWGGEEAYHDITFEQWLHQITDDQGIHGAMDWIIRAMTGMNYFDISASEYIKILRNFGRFKGVTTAPKDGNKSTTDALMELIRGLNVQIFLASTVEEIYVEDGKAVAVKATNPAGKHFDIESKYIISDAGPKETVNLAKNKFPDSYVKMVKGLTEVNSATTIFAYEKPITNYDGFFCWPEAYRIATVWEPHYCWPGYAPKGQYCLYCFCTFRTNNIQKEVQLGQEECMQEFPALRKARILHVNIFSAHWPVLRARAGKTLNHKTPIENLYTIGDAINPPGWTVGEGVAVIVNEVVSDILSSMKS
jgi:phytoene dehydrogenase-like protein